MLSLTEPLIYSCASILWCTAALNFKQIERYLQVNHVHHWNCMFHFEGMESYLRSPTLRDADRDWISLWTTTQGHLVSHPWPYPAVTIVTNDTSKNAFLILTLQIFLCQTLTISKFLNTGNNNSYHINKLTALQIHVKLIAAMGDTCTALERWLLFHFVYLK